MNEIAKRLQNQKEEVIKEIKLQKQEIKEGIKKFGIDWIYSDPALCLFKRLDSLKKDLNFLKDIQGTNFIKEDLD